MRVPMPGTQDFDFATGAQPKGRLRLLGFHGREAVSRLFAFDLLLEQDDAPLEDGEIDALFRSPCGFAMGAGKGDFVRGLATRVRMLDRAGEQGFRYVISIAPTMWLLTLGG